MKVVGLSRNTAARRGTKQFRLRLVPCLITLLAIAILVKLGLWQIDRGQEKQAILDQHAAAQSAGPQRLQQPLIDQRQLQQDDLVEVTGSFSAGNYLLIDNQILAGRVGYHVVALLVVEDLRPAIPVNLGWVPIPGRRDILPEIDLPRGPLHIQGRVNLPAERPFLLNEQQFSTQLPQRVQYLELAPLSDTLQRELAYFSILLDESADFGFARDWPVVVSEPHRHYAYAVQWFGLAIAAFVIFIIASRRPLQSSRQENNNNDHQ